MHPPPFPQGSHDQLMGIMDGGYARLVAAQTGGRSAIGASASKADLTEDL